MNTFNYTPALHAAQSSIGTASGPEQRRKGAKHTPGGEKEGPSAGTNRPPALPLPHSAAPPCATRGSRARSASPPLRGASLRQRTVPVPRGSSVGAPFWCLAPCCVAIDGELPTLTQVCGADSRPRRCLQNIRSTATGCAAFRAQPCIQCISQFSSLNSLRKCPPPPPQILNFGQGSVVDTRGVP